MDAVSGADEITAMVADVYCFGWIDSQAAMEVLADAFDLPGWRAALLLADVVRVYCEVGKTLPRDVPGRWTP